MTYIYQYDGKTYEVEITIKQLKDKTASSTELADEEAKPPRKPRIPLIIVSPAAFEEENQ